VSTSRSCCARTPGKPLRSDDQFVELPGPNDDPGRALRVHDDAMGPTEELSWKAGRLSCSHAGVLNPRLLFIAEHQRGWVWLASLQVIHPAGASSWDEAGGRP